MLHFRPAFSLALALVLPICGGAQSATPVTSSSSGPDAPRIATLGASVTAGFRIERYLGFLENARELTETRLGRKLTDDEWKARVDSVKPADVLAAAYGREIESHDDNFMFQSPEKRGRKLLEAAFQTDLDLALGLDFVFWFGYGTMKDTAPGTPASTAARIALQERGLALLDEFLDKHPETTLVVGDYPDLTGALPLMISADMIPTVTELAELNRRLAEWANAKPRVHVFSLSSCLERLRAGESKIYVGDEQRRVDADAAFQIARVHPTRIGVALLVRDLAVWLSERMPDALMPKTFADATIAEAAGVK